MTEAIHVKYVLLPSFTTRRNLYHLSKMTEELETREKDVVETMQRFINEMTTTSVLPLTLYFQINYCAWEKKFS